MIIFAAAFLGLLVVVIFWRSPEDPDKVAADNRLWAQALSTSGGPVFKAMTAAAKPFARLRPVQNMAASPHYRALQEKIAATDTYAGSLEIFLAYQALTIFIAFTCLLAYITQVISDTTGLVIAVLGILLVFFPYNQVSQKLKKQNEEIMRELPEFAELLLMPLSAGMSPVQAMGFTVNYVHGKVAHEINELLNTLATNPTDPMAAFTLTGVRLGLPEAQAFFTSLGQAYVKGTKVMDNIRQQADSLRNKAYQEERTKIKKMPVTLVFVAALHFLPFLFIVAFIPLVYAFGHSIGQ